MATVSRTIGNSGTGSIRKTRRIRPAYPATAGVMRTSRFISTASSSLAAIPASVPGMTRFWPGLFIVFGCLSARSAKLSPPERVWSDFDPRAEPLEIEVLKRWCEHEANYTEFLFTGLTNGPEKVRVYAIYSAPVGGTNLPAVLHIHGGGQTVNPQWL